MSSESSRTASVAGIGALQVRQGPSFLLRLRLAMTLLVLAFTAATIGNDGHAQGSPPAAPAAKPDTAPATADGVPGRAPPRGTGRLGESVDHGFFGNLSAPPPPAVDRIQGVRLPDAEPVRPTTPAAGASKPSAGSADAPTPRGESAATVPPPSPGQAPAPPAPTPASPVAEQSPAQAAPAAPSAR